MTDDPLRKILEEEAEAVENMTDAEKQMLQHESDAWRKTMEPAARKVIFEQEASHNKVMDLGRHPKSFENILKEFSQDHFKYGAATMNVQSEGGTRHLTIRLWGTHLQRCPLCHRVREMTWALADEGRAIHCYSHCGMVLRPKKQPDDDLAIQLAASRGMLGKVRL